MQKSLFVSTFTMHKFVGGIYNWLFETTSKLTSNNMVAELRHDFVFFLNL